MALPSLSLRRVLSLSSSLTKHQRLFSAFPAISISPSLSSATANPQNPSSDLIQPHLPFQSRNFRSSSAWLDRFRPSFRNNNNNNDDEIGPDTILFEGCDYNHWLITMDFPKDPAPTREEMIETYLQTLAKVVGSYEEAKKRMYAFSTTTYVGFNCLVTEEMSEKFKTLPGVVFVLPDSYIDPVNKEYGGDKYENGVITPRPPPQQYGRSGGRYGDRNRDQNRPRRQQGNPTYGNQGPIYGDTRNFGQQNNSPMQPSYSPMGTGGDRRNPMPMNNAQATYNQNEQQNNSPMQPSYSPMGTGGDRRNPMPMNNAQATYNQNEQGYYNPLGGRIAPEQRNYMPPGQNDISGVNRNYAPPQSVPFGQGAGGNYDQGARGNYGQGAGGNQGQGFGVGHNRETGFGYGQSYAGPGEGPRFSQVEQRDNMQGEQRNYTPMTHNDRARY